MGLRTLVLAFLVHNHLSEILYTSNFIQKRRRKSKKDPPIKTPTSKVDGVTPTIGITTPKHNTPPSSNRKADRKKLREDDLSVDEKAPGSCCTLM
mmetsp:Transcript_19410/g.27326  ORF Transcript_19410/g.27326 Transcript_19410/m.27326 type:complete len:95 (-) Transcript_19410:108-392(-)